jgi:DNA-binding beta-propeller fold protein YncE
MRSTALAVALRLLLPAGAGLAAQQPTAASPFTLYVSSEAGDVVTRIEVGPAGWRIAREIPVGLMVTDLDGPHHVAVSADGRFWYVSLAHGTPFGAVWQYATGSDSLLARVQVGMFPTTIGLSPDGAWAFVPNSDFHGDRGRQNTVSVLYTADLTQVVEIPTCDMPHGSRFNHAGTAVYIACMMSDELVEIDPSVLAITRRIPLGSGTPAAHAEHGGAAGPPGLPPGLPRRPGAASSTMPGQNPDCLTTYVSVSPDDAHVYLACHHSNELQVRDATTLALARRLPTGEGAYNVEPSPDGRWVLVTNKKGQSVSVFETTGWREVARVPTSKRVPHGIAFSPDGRYAFVTVESVGSDPGAVDAIDLGTLTRIASMSIARQPTGIAVCCKRRHGTEGDGRGRKETEGDGRWGARRVP